LIWHRDRDAALLASLGELAVSHWLGVECGCGRSAKLPCKLLARQSGRTTLVRDVLRRLRCEQYGAPTTRVYLTDDPADGTSGQVAWRVELLP
jgi:hypothetical protein